MMRAIDHDRCDEYAEYFERLMIAFHCDRTKKDVLELAQMVYESTVGFQAHRAESGRHWRAEP